MVTNCLEIPYTGFDCLRILDIAEHDQKDDMRFRFLSSNEFSPMVTNCLEIPYTGLRNTATRTENWKKRQKLGRSSRCTRRLPPHRLQEEQIASSRNHPSPQRSQKSLYNPVVS